MQQDSLVQDENMIDLTEVGRLVDGDQATVWHRRSVYVSGALMVEYNKRLESPSGQSVGPWLLKDWMDLYPSDLELIVKSKRIWRG